VKDQINIFYPNGKNKMGRVVISQTEMVIYKYKMLSAAISSAGALGAILGGILGAEKEILRLNIADIICTKTEKFRLNKNAYHITMKDSNTYICCFENPKKTIPYLESLINNKKE